MKILLISPWLPWPLYDGGRIRIYETLRYLSRRHSVTLVTSVPGAREREHTAFLKGYCDQIVTAVLSNGTGAVFSRISKGLLTRKSLVESFYYDARIADHVRDLTARTAYDVIQVEFPFLTPYLKAVEPRSGAKKILTMHNVESLRFERELRLTQWGKRRMVLLGDHLFFRAWEKKALAQFDGIVTVSDSERKWVEHHAPRAMVNLVPNGVDTEYFKPMAHSASEGGPYVVFTGAMDYPPNVDAARWFCNEVLPALQRKIPGIGFKIVGKNPLRRILELRDRDGVEVTGTVADIRGFISGALALVVPLRSGGGTRLKILEAMAMERPVISTSVGAEGLEITPGADILIANSAEEFVDRVLLLQNTRDLSQILGKASRRLVAEKYDWGTCLSGLDRLYNRLVGEKAA